MLGRQIISPLPSGRAFAPPSETSGDGHCLRQDTDWVSEWSSEFISRKSNPFGILLPTNDNPVTPLQILLILLPNTSSHPSDCFSLQPKRRFSLGAPHRQGQQKRRLTLSLCTQNSHHL